jgi:hypothetical protein
MAVEHATVAAAELLCRHGILSIALRGPVLVRMLYDEHEARSSLDVDLLVPDLPAASKILIENGYELVVDWTPGMEKHAWTHAKENAVSVDLHRTMVGIDADPSTAWRVLERESEATELIGGTVCVPRRAAQALTVALHAAQHGSATAQTSADLGRALTRFEIADWQRAAALARELAAEPALASALRQSLEGTRLADELGLLEADSRRTAIRSTHGSAEPVVLGLDSLLALRGKSRLTFAVGKLAPAPGFMHERYPWSRRGRGALAAAYAYRIGWMLWHLPAGIRRLRAADRRSR